MRVAVIGAGIAGITAAYEMAKRGWCISVYDEARYPAMKTSFANGAQLSVSNSETWNTWSNIHKGIGWMFKEDAPLLMRPDLDLIKYEWLARFMYHTVKGDYRKNTIETIHLGIRAREIYRQIAEAEHLEFDQSDCGILHIYKDRDYYNKAVDAKNIYKASGYSEEWQTISSDEVRRLEPTLNSGTEIVGGVWTPNDYVGDIHRFCSDLAVVLKEKYQVEFRFNYPVNDLEDFALYFDAVVVANGVGAVKLAKTIGDRLPIYPVKGYSITVNLDSESYDHSPFRSILDDQAKIVCSRLGNRLRIAGTAELAGENYDILRSRIEPLLTWVHETFPEINTSDYHSWACLRPMTPNMMPIVKKSTKNKKVFYHAGHGHLGWTLAAGTAEKLAEQIYESTQSI
jgi:D-amino-acid dehydrogenase